MPRLSHVGADGKVRMVDVGRKRATRREAVARGRVVVSRKAFRLLRENGLSKGDVAAVAQVAGIQAAKRTWELIPLCHPLSLDNIDVALTLDDEGCQVLIEARAVTRGPTGVEMEALTAVAVAGLTVYDMVKSVDKRAVVSDIRLIEKKGGKSGHFRRSPG